MLSNLPGRRCPLDAFAVLPMSCWPLIERELLQALRRGNAIRRRRNAAIAGVAVTGVMLLFDLGFTKVSGTTLNLWLFLLGLYAAVVQTGEMTTGLFVQERQHGTYGLLFLSGLTPGEVFIGKLFGAAAIVLFNLLAIVPVLAVPFLLGGVSIDLFLATIGALPVMLLFALSTSVLASLIAHEDGQAFTTWLLVLAMTCVTPFLLDVGDRFFGSHAGLNLKQLSPAYAPFLVASGLPPTAVARCWTSLGVSVLWSVVMLTVSAALLRRHWRLQVAGPIVSPWRARVRGWLFGSPEWRAGLRTQFLDINPFAWLILRDRQPVLLAGLSLIVFVVLWLLGWWLWPAGWLNGTLFIAAGLFAVIILNAHVSHAAARRVAEARKDGSLELLLTTPLPIVDILDGQASALREQFKPVIWASAAICLLLTIGGLFTRDWTRAALFDYSVIWAWLLYAHHYIGRTDRALPMWAALNTGRSSHQFFPIWRASIPFLIIITFQLFRGARSFTMSGAASFTFPTGSTVELVVVIFSSLIALLWIGAAQQEWAASEMRFKLLTHFRTIAMNPVPASNDPRLNGWDMNDPLPTACHIDPLIVRNLRRTRRPGNNQG